MQFKFYMQFHEIYVFPCIYTLSKLQISKCFLRNFLPQNLRFVLANIKSVCYVWMRYDLH